MSPRGRTPVGKDERAGHRKGVGEGSTLEVVPVESRLIGAEPPPDLSPVAAELWNICVADMAILGHLREPDLMLLRGYCETAGFMVEAAESIKKHGLTMAEPIVAMDIATGADVVIGHRLKVNPALKVHNACFDRLRMASGDLALNPMARVRGNLLEAATSSIALSILTDIEAAVRAKNAAAAKAAKRPRSKK